LINIGPIPAVLALVALVLGVPHDAAALVIIAFPEFGFVLVLATTVWHFGTDDVEATAELQGESPLPEHSEFFVS